jgi:hypothetical protein
MDFFGPMPQELTHGVIDQLLTNRLGPEHAREHLKQALQAILRFRSASRAAYDAVCTHPVSRILSALGDPKYGRSLITACEQGDDYTIGANFRSVTVDSLYACAIVEGDVETLRFAHKYGLFWHGRRCFREGLDETREFLSWLQEGEEETPDHHVCWLKCGKTGLCPGGMCSLAARYGQVEVLAFLRGVLEVAWDEETIVDAVVGNYPAGGCRFLIDADIRPALGCLRYALDPPPFVDGSPQTPCPLNGLDGSSLATAAAGNTRGGAAVLQLLRDPPAFPDGAPREPCPWDGGAVDNAILCDNPPALRFLLGPPPRADGTVQRPCPHESDVLIKAAARSNVALLETICESGAAVSLRWSAEICACAAAGDRYEPWLTPLTRVARPEEDAACLETLRWLRAPPARNDGTAREPCPWDSRTTLAAARFGNFKTLRWAVERDCPFDLAQCLNAIDEAQQPRLCAFLRRRAAEPASGLPLRGGSPAPAQ